jgi:hypothetical protein
VRRATLLVLVVALAAASAAAADPRPVKPPRAAINALLDHFIPDVLAGRDLRAGKAFVGGYVSVDTVQRYPVEGHDFHGWVLNYSYPGDVGFDILLQPTKKSLGPWSFRAEAQRLHGRWKITDWYPVAEFQPPGKPARVDGPNDLSPAARGGASGSTSHMWYLWIVPAAAGALVVLATLFGVQRWLRQRSRVRAIERALASSR